jgi:hypothetical protein
LEQQLWAARVRARLRERPMLTAIGGEWGTVEPSDGQAEWDLELANWLDGVYTTVSDRANEVRTKSLAAVNETVSSVGFNVWPLALAAAVVLVAYGFAKR